MTDKLPHNLLNLFAPRPTLRWVPPIDVPPEKRHTPAVSGTADFVEALREYKETDNANWADFDCDDDAHNEEVHERFNKSGWTDSENQKRVNKRLEKREKQKKLITEDAKDFNPKNDPRLDPKVVGEAVNTLFVGRLSYKVGERELEREFGRFGPITKIRVVRDEPLVKPDEGAPGYAKAMVEYKEAVKKAEKKPHRGYAFVVFESQHNAKAAAMQTNGRMIGDRPVVVDVERGRTVKDWLPRRLGGGLGGRHYTKIISRPGGYQNGPLGPGGFRGRGGMRGGYSDGPRGGSFSRGRGAYERGGFGSSDRGGYGSQRGFGFQGSPPEGAPAGPRARGGFSDPASGRAYDSQLPAFNGYEAQNGYARGGGRQESRGFSGSNAEPVASRNRYQGRNGRTDDGARGHDREVKMEDRSDRGDEYTRKRHHDHHEYDDHRSKRRY